MSVEETVVVLSLFDSYWFQYGVFTSKPPPLISSTEHVKIISPVREGDEDEDDEKPKLNRMITTTGLIMRKSYSDQHLRPRLSSSKDDFPNMPPPSHHQLQTILSGKESRGHMPPHEKADHRIKEPSIRRKSSSKSLSELEFEELKGFMDLGFVFSDDQEKEEDEDYSRLVKIIPGLQRERRRRRLDDGKNNIINNVELDKSNYKGGFISTDHEEQYYSSSSSSSSSVSISRRSYLSEAWDYSLDQKTTRVMNKNNQNNSNNPMLLDHWRIPANYYSGRNEMEFKDHLRFWAHTVASTVI
ncbi:hypothetical protein BUALT_Bualt03G0184700 [Buddleja alternifolia]|uniref:Uncharacterized protein n=1 Tax=Buddleja alternifolia TaxID=168488 RepID=A0AAV6Y2Y8_9LAMI|nr:hypothetical protein BUALT_Bualt03G0184700 [Buddleja alternifolia]